MYGDKIVGIYFYFCFSGVVLLEILGDVGMSSHGG